MLLSDAGQGFHANESPVMDLFVFYHNVERSCRTSASLQPKEGSDFAKYGLMFRAECCNDTAPRCQICRTATASLRKAVNVDRFTLISDKQKQTSCIFSG